MITGVNGVTLTIPLNITVSLGDASEPKRSVSADTKAAVADTSAKVTDQPSEGFLESVTPDPDYEDRPGYDPDFLGFNAPLPKLDASIKGDAVKIDGAKKASENELKYHHYSVIMNGKRRIAFVAAVNYNAKAKVHYARTVKDKWFFDPRIDEALQAGEEFYEANPLDRGHLVRRADGGWGSTEKAAKTANDDTFHFTNCSPQHEIFNQSAKASHEGFLLWGNLENHVAKQGKTANGGKLAVFNGPVLRKNDRPHRGLRVPKEFWKIIVYERDNGKPGAAAFILSQSQLIKNLPEEEFEAEEYKPFQVRVTDLESKTKLDFGKFRKWDSLPDDADESLFESGTEAISIKSLDDVIL
jgi:endonuclease G